MTIKKALVVDIPDLMDKVILAQRSTGNKTWRTRNAIAIGFQTHYTLDARKGTFNLTGTNTLRYRDLELDTGSFIFTGLDATLSKGFAVSASSGLYTLSGTDINFLFTRIMSLGGGSYSLTGQDAVLARGLFLATDTGSYLLEGSDTDLVWFVRLDSRETFTAGRIAFVYTAQNIN